MVRDPNLLPKTWLELVDYVHLHPFCELNIIFKDGYPVMIEKGVESIKLQ